MIYCIESLGKAQTIMETEKNQDDFDK